MINRVTKFQRLQALMTNTLVTMNLLEKLIIKKKLDTTKDTGPTGINMSQLKGPEDIIVPKEIIGLLETILMIATKELILGDIEYWKVHLQKEVGSMILAETEIVALIMKGRIFMMIGTNFQKGKE